MHSRHDKARTQTSSSLQQGTPFAPIPYTHRRLGLTQAIYDYFYIQINEAITKYNRAEDNNTKLEALNNMQEALHYVDVHAAAEDEPGNLTQATEFHTNKTTLFKQIKTAYADLGVTTLVRRTPGRDDSPVAQIISDLPPDKADSLMEILHKGVSSTLNDELKGLYNEQDTSQEAKQWASFLDNHSIEFLGGGNSQNFSVINNTNQQVKVLKVDNRLGMPRHTEEHLREALPDVFIPVDAERQVLGLCPLSKNRSKTQNGSRTLIVTDFCSLGSVLEHSETVRAKKDDNELYKSSSNLMGQMIGVLSKIQGSNCCFPDAKLTNWLVDENGRIRLADSKSFVFTFNGRYEKHLPGNEGTSHELLHTNRFTPKELTSPPFDAEPLHAAILGCNLYTYLAGNTLPDKTKERKNESIFQSELGQEYLKLINQLVKDPPHTRMSLGEAQTQLQHLANLTDPEYYLDNKTKQLSDKFNFNLKPFVDKKISSDKALNDYDKEASLKQIASSLDELEQRVQQCQNLINELGALDVSDAPQLKSILTEQLETKLKRGTSLDDLTSKLQAFQQELAQGKQEIVLRRDQCTKISHKLVSLEVGTTQLINESLLITKALAALQGSLSIEEFSNKLTAFEHELQHDLERIDPIALAFDKSITELSRFKINEQQVIDRKIFVTKIDNIKNRSSSINDLLVGCSQCHKELELDLTKLTNDFEGCAPLVEEIAGLTIDGKPLIAPEQLIAYQANALLAAQSMEVSSLYHRVNAITAI